jgi:hypothetical protein
MKLQLSKQLFALPMTLMLFSLLPAWVGAQNTLADSLESDNVLSEPVINSAEDSLEWSTVTDAQQLKSRRCQEPFNFCPFGLCCRYGRCVRCLPWWSDASEIIYNEDPASSSIKYWLETDGTVSINLYDAAGQLIRTLVDEWMESGDHELVWNENEDIENKLRPGMYLVTLQTGDISETTRVMAFN